MKKSIPVLAAMLTFALLALPVLAQTSPPADPPACPAKAKEADKGGFEKMDADKDGKLSFDELKAARPKMTQERFDKMDADKDKFISKEEGRKAHEAQKAAADKAKKNKAKAKAKGEVKEKKQPKEDCTKKDEGEKKDAATAPPACETKS